MKFDTITINGLWIPSAHSITIEQPSPIEGWSKADEAQWWTGVPKSLPVSYRSDPWMKAFVRLFQGHHLPKRLRRKR